MLYIHMYMYSVTLIGHPICAIGEQFNVLASRELSRGKCLSLRYVHSRISTYMYFYIVDQNEVLVNQSSLLVTNLLYW